MSEFAERLAEIVESDVGDTAFRVKVSDPDGVREAIAREAARCERATGATMEEIAPLAARTVVAHFAARRPQPRLSRDALTDLAAMWAMGVVAGAEARGDV